MKLEPLSYARPSPQRGAFQIATIAFLIACAGFFASLLAWFSVIHAEHPSLARILAFVGLFPSIGGTLLAISSLYRGQRNLYGWWAFYVSVCGWLLSLIVLAMVLH